MCKQFGIAVIRAVIILSNLVLFLGTVALIYRGSVLYSQYKSYEVILDATLQTQPLICLILGIIVCIFSLFGFLAICLNALGMTVFFILFMLIFGLVFTIFGVILINETGTMYTDDKYFANYVDRRENITLDPDKLAGVENVQRDLLCCGLHSGPASYTNISQPLPQSCCKDPEHHCLPDDVWETDCLFQIELFGLVSYTELAAFMMCIAAQCFIVAAVGYVFAMAIRQYYYY